MFDENLVTVESDASSPISSQVYGNPRCTGIPGVPESQVYGNPRCTGIPGVRESQVYGNPRCTGIPGVR